MNSEDSKPDVRPGYDVRAVANLVLNVASQSGRNVTNLHLNKVLYFMYVEFMREFGEPLTRAKIEAWNYGPVFREIYGQFKRFKDRPISCKAVRIDYDTGEPVEVFAEFQAGHFKFLIDSADYYSGFPASLLVDLSHEPGGAWAKVWNHKQKLNIGMEITPDLVRELEVGRQNRVRKN